MHYLAQIFNHTKSTLLHSSAPPHESMRTLIWYRLLFKLRTCTDRLIDIDIDYCILVRVFANPNYLKERVARERNSLKLNICHIKPRLFPSLWEFPEIICPGNSAFCHQSSPLMTFDFCLKTLAEWQGLEPSLSWLAARAPTNWAIEARYKDLNS